MRNACHLSLAIVECFARLFPLFQTPNSAIIFKEFMLHDELSKQDQIKLASVMYFQIIVFLKKLNSTVKAAKKKKLGYRESNPEPVGTFLALLGNEPGSL